MTSSTPKRLLHRPSWTWLSLLYDLAFAGAAVVISSYLSTQPTMDQVFWLGTVVGVLWLIWLLTGIVTGDLLRERTGVDNADPLTVCLVAAQMVCVLLAAVAADSSIEGSSSAFDVFAGLSLLTVAALAYRCRRATTNTVRFRSVVLSVAPVLAGVLLIVGASFSDGAAAWSLWLLPFVLLLALVTYAVDRLPLDVHRLGHRLGELTIVVIGETLLKIGLAGSTESVYGLKVTGVIWSISLLVVIWWIYFTPGRVPRAAPVAKWWVAIHAFLHVGLLALAVALGKMVTFDTKLAERPELLVWPVLGICVCLWLLDEADVGCTTATQRWSWVATIVAVAGVGLWLDAVAVSPVFGGMALTIVVSIKALSRILLEREARAQ